MNNNVSIEDVKSGRVDISILEGGELLGHVLFTRFQSQNNKGDLIVFIEEYDLGETCIEDIEEKKANANRNLPVGISDMSVYVGRMFLHGDLDDENALIRVNPKDGAMQFSYNDMVSLDDILTLLQNNKSGKSIMVEVAGKLITFN